MENKKKKESKTAKKTTPSKKVKTTKIPAKKKTTKKKAFTLIELLAVIIILGILMIIAIPSVTSYISNSRKSAYVSTAKALMDGARTKVNEGKLSVYDTDTTYYIPAEMIKTESGGSKSPYGDFTEAYVAVTYDGEGFDYYWISTDSSKMGVKGLTKYDDLEQEDIVANVEQFNIDTGINGRSNIVVFDDKGEISQRLTAAKQYNPETNETTDRITKICITRNLYDKDNANYYTYTGNPTIQDLIDNGTIILENFESLDYFYMKEYYSCIENNPYQDTHSEDYSHYTINCQNTYGEKYPNYQDQVKDSTIGCYVARVPK